MKKTILLSMLLAGGVMFTSCKNDSADSAVPQTPVQDGYGVVKFALASQNAFQTTRAYVADDLSVMQFKENTDGDFIYNGTVSFTSTEVTDNVITGSTQLPFGKYKFISSYGVAAATDVMAPTLTDAALTDALAYTYTGASVPEFYLDQEALDAVPTYTVDYSAPVNVTTTLKRAVGRVDMMFVRADSDGAATPAYTDLGTPAFGNNTLGSVAEAFTGLTSTMNLAGGAAGTPATVSKDFTSTTFITGTGSATTVGESGYQGYDAIAATELNAGTVYVVGDYVFPNNTDTSAVGLTVNLYEATDAAQAYPRTLTFTELPIERNKITLIKVYILNDDPFQAPVAFEVTMVSDFEDPIVVTEELE